MHLRNLSSLIKNICSTQYTHCELLEFVNLSQRIAVSYLKYQEVTGKNISLDKRGTYNNLDDVAMDCIATLFMRDDKGQFTQLQRYFVDVTNCVKDVSDSEILVKLRGLVIKKTKQELSRIFRERDPEGAKILRNVRVALKSASDIGSFKDMGREFIFSEIIASGFDENPEIVLTKTEFSAPAANSKLYLENYPNLRRSQPGIPERILRQQFLMYYSPKDPVSILLRKMLWIIAQYPDYQNFVAIDIIVNIIRTMNQEMFHERMTSGIENSSPLDELRHKEIHQAVGESIDYIAQKIKRQYVRKNKITEQKAKIYLTTISDLITDLASGKSIESNFTYLTRYIPEMSQRQYREDERSIFEYLVKLAKNALIKKLETLL